MDPNALLERIRELVAATFVSEDGSYADDLAGAFDDLDEWLSKGGFLPSAWKRETA